MEGVRTVLNQGLSAASGAGCGTNRPGCGGSGRWRRGRGSSREPGGKGSFQAVKLQRPARTTVCSHSTRDIAAMGSVETKHDIKDSQYGCLSSCGQLRSNAKTNVWTPCSGWSAANDPKIDGHSVARKINVSALGIGPDQLYPQLVSNICALLSFGQ